MSKKTLPTHPRTGLRALGVLSNGRPIWPVLGAAEDGGQGDDGAPPEGDGGTGGDDGGDDDPAGGRQDDHADDGFDEDRARKAIAKKNSENASLRKRLKELEPLAAKAKELEDAGKTEAQRLTEDRDGHRTRADKAEAEAARLRVALKKGLTATQAKRLVGSTEDELEADADELLASFSPQDGPKPKPPAGKPRPNLRGGGNPDDPPEETDPAKLADAIGRR